MRFPAVILVMLALGFGQNARLQSDDPSSVENIMARVGANQDRIEKLRSDYHCKEHIRVVTRKRNGRVMREETADYESVSTATGPQVQLRSLTGRYWHNGKYEDFNGEPVPDPKSWDADYIHDVRRCLTAESTCPGAPHLFPLTTEEQNKYDFHLIGQETWKGRKTYRVGFAPKSKEMYAWAGEAFIDANDFQPIRIFTKLSRNLPFVVRAMGTNIAGFGYELDYHRDESGNWFPAAYGTEYELRLFFHINRTITVSMDTSFVAAAKTPATQ